MSCRHIYIVDSYIDLSGPSVCLSNSLCMHAWVRYFLGVTNDPDLLILDFGTLIRVGFYVSCWREFWNLRFRQTRSSSRPRCGLWSRSSPRISSWRCLSTQPVFVNKLMGVVTGMDVVVILMVLFAVVWIFVQFYLPQAHKIDTSTPPPGTKKYVVMH